MKIVIRSGGDVKLLYQEQLDLADLGEKNIERISHIDWLHGMKDWRPGWYAEIFRDILEESEYLGPFATRSEALAAEVQWLEEHVLTSAEGVSHAET